ncbi:hypothetical protein, partial [Klebsiella pneumoniae]|uniref:hypothetical protein n=1 Tax=Klebsiella pneumoniae TaxID=573 RepID=UPI001C0CE1A2
AKASLSYSQSRQRQKISLQLAMQGIKKGKPGANVTGYTCSNQRWSDGRNVRWIKTRQFHESGQTPKAPGRGIEKMALLQS